MARRPGILAIILLAAAPLQAGQSPRLFDPARHMRIAEVREGMSGYGLSVFTGTRIEKFEVKVLSVLRNVFAPRADVVLIECKGANLEKTGIPAGASGSPVFLIDGAGKPRMIGAIAYGFPFTQAPIAGVQPIEYMLALADVPPAAPAALPGKKEIRARWSIQDVRLLAAASPKFATIPLGTGTVKLMPLASPLMTAGVPQHVLSQLSPLFSTWGMMPLQAGGAGAAAGAQHENVSLEPGSVLAVPLITGDIESTVIGTCTEVIGNTIVALGHQISNEGPVALPMGAGRINAVIPSLQSSFKLGSLVQIIGMVTADQQAGAAGLIGKEAPMIPLQLRIAYADGTLQRDYKLKIISHPKLTAAAAGLAVQTLLSATRELPQYHTLDYDLQLEFAGGESVRLNNTLVNAQGMELLTEVALPIMSAAENPFERVMLTKLTGRINVTSEARTAKILAVHLPRTRYQPGETARLFVTYRPFRGEETSLPVDFEIPRDVGDGSYQLAVTDWDTFVEQEKLARPFRFTAENAAEVFTVLKDVLAVKHNAIYVRLVRQPDGVAIGRTAMPRLPSSMRQVLLGAGLSNTAPFVSSTLKVAPTELVMDGSANFALTIAREFKLSSAAAKTSPHAETKTSTPPVPGNEEQEKRESRREK